MTRVINVLKYCNGTIDLNDKSVDSKTIENIFEMSTRDFKKVIGMLYKEKVIRVHKKPARIELSDWNYDINNGINDRMLKDKPLWEYGLIAPSYEAQLPDIVKKEYNKQNRFYDKKTSLFSTRKSTNANTNTNANTAGQYD